MVRVGGRLQGFLAVQGCGRDKKAGADMIPRRGLLVILEQTAFF